MNTKIGIIIAGLVVAIIIIVLVVQDNKTSPVLENDYSADTQTQLETESEAEMQAQVELEMQAEQVPIDPMVIPAAEPVEPTPTPAFPTTGFEK